MQSQDLGTHPPWEGYRDLPGSISGEAGCKEARVWAVLGCKKQFVGKKESNQEGSELYEFGVDPRSPQEEVLVALFMHIATCGGIPDYIDEFGCQEDLNPSSKDKDWPQHEPCMPVILLPIVKTPLSINDTLASTGLIN